MSERAAIDEIYEAFLIEHCSRWSGVGAVAKRLVGLMNAATQRRGRITGGRPNRERSTARTAGPNRGIGRPQPLEGSCLESVF